MAIGDDFSVAVNGDIRHVSGTATYTVIELHRFLQDLADNATETGDDFLSIIRVTPSQRSTDNIITLINGYNIDDTAAEFLYDGSIIQANGATIYDGIQNFGNAVHIEVLQNGSLIANDFWNLGGSGLNADANAGISHRFLVKTRDSGADIDGRRLLGLTREFGNTYSEFPINGTARGNNVLALSEANDLNNNTVVGTVAGFTDITNVEGYQTIDLQNGNGAQPYYSQWNRGSRTINQLYERAKWLTRRGETTTIYGIQGQIFRGITHQIAIDNPTGTFSAVEAVSWTGGTGQMLAIDSTTAGTLMWIQLLTGVAPTDGLTITGGTSSATADVNVTVTDRTISPVFLGQSTGTAIIGAYGVGIEQLDLTSADTLFNLSNVAQSPPTTAVFTVNGVVSTEDQILVTEDASSNINFNQMALATALTGATETAVVIGNVAGDNTTIPTDTPSPPVAGTTTIRVQRNSGRYERIQYTSHDSNVTFTIPSTDFSTDNASVGNNVFIGYIDKLAASGTESFQVIYNADRTLFVRVRDGGAGKGDTPIITFETTATLGSGGGASTVIRTSDA